METAVKFRYLQINKILNTDTNKIFQSLSRLFVDNFKIYIVWEKNSVVSRSGYFGLLGVNQKFSLTNAFDLFLNWTYFFDTKKIIINCCQKSALKYLVYCQIFWVEVRRLQDQYIPLGALVFYYCNTNVSFSKYVF